MVDTFLTNIDELKEQRDECRPGHDCHEAYTSAARSGEKISRQ